MTRPLDARAALVPPRVKAQRHLRETVIKHVKDERARAELLDAAYALEQAVRAEEESSVREAGLTAPMPGEFR